ncbi:MAG: phospholipid/cholesterol/gamma-HCH transport system substrate-binding protein [Pseudonocardiales bacterium]|nr:phospholipid/cholesterol/gamma-HCH transport system substrate-binding protein [Pseudonocardiales bacterium]
MKIGRIVRLLAFFAVAGLFAVMELTTLTGPHTGTTDSYSAIFGGADGVSGLRTGNPVRVAGVAVGKVTGVDLVDAKHAKVTFTANRRQQITDHTWAVVRYANLLGQRYLALTRSEAGGATMRPGSTIPQGRTAPALSLTDLFNGFRPLFSALRPEQVNELSQNIIDVLQGQTDRIGDLVARTADLTGNLAERDKTFSDVVDSLSQLLGTVAKHDDQLAGAVRALHALTSALHTEGPAIAGSLDAVDQLMGSVGGLLAELDDHSLPRDIADAASLTKVLADNTGTVSNLVSGFASAFETFARVSQNGNWINIYACNVFVKTYGSVQVSVDQIIGGLDGFLGQVPALGDLLDQILRGVGLPGIGGGGLGGVLGGLKLDIPLQLPNGRVGGSNAHTGVCK